MSDANDNKMVKQLNTTLPEASALYDGKIAGNGTPLVQSDMETAPEQECGEVRSLPSRSVHENQYADWSASDLDEARKAAEA
ncbi:MAG: hypothetical protein ACFBZ9_11980 [Sphingomonadales bacterium]